MLLPLDGRRYSAFNRRSTIVLNASNKECLETFIFFTRYIVVISVSHHAKFPAPLPSLPNKRCCVEHIRATLLLPTHEPLHSWKQAEVICCKGGSALKSELRLTDDMTAEEISRDLSGIGTREPRQRLESRFAVYE